MIPDLPKSVTLTDALAFYSDILSNLEEQSSIHVNWHTHKQNPSVCWLCDIPICARKIAYLTEQIITKSTCDIVDELSSDKDSEPEIENEFLNKNDELVPSREPEYDVVSSQGEQEN